MATHPSVRPSADSFDLSPAGAGSGEIIAGKYCIVAALGRGGMADVFLGISPGPAGFNKLVVVKKLREGRADNPSIVTMFLDEARLAARLNHPNIVHTYEVGEEVDGYVLVMEYLEGQSLRRVARALKARGQSLSPALAAHVVSEALNGLQHAHELADYDGSPLGIVHRDVSPHNLFVTYDGQVKVLDFGIAKAALNATDTQDGVLKGKFSYMAPEQASAQNVDRRADVFAIGIILWELLTGARLFPGDAAPTLLNVMQSPIPAPSTVAHGIAPELDAIVLRALERSPDRRYASAQDMSRALTDWLHRSGANVHRVDLASQMEALFADVREGMARKVQAYMTSPRGREMMVSGEHTNSAMRSVRSFGNATTGSAPALQIGPTPRKAATWLPFAVGGAVVAVAALAAGFFLRSKPSHATTDPSSAAAAGATSFAAAAARQDEESFHLTLSSDPPEADVEWGGKAVGQTPLMIDLTPGPHTFVLSRDGFFRATVVVNVTGGMAGRNEPRTVVLVARKGVPALAPAAKGESAAVVAHASSNAKAVHAERAEPTPSAEPAAAAPSAVPVALVDSAHATAPAPVAPAMVATTVAAPAASPAASPAAPTAPVVLSYGPDMTRPTLVSGKEIVYSREAIVAGVEGAMIGKCTIQVDGSLQNCRVIKGLPYMDKPFLDSLATRRYKPVMRDGKAVAVEYVFNMRVAVPH